MCFKLKRRKNRVIIRGGGAGSGLVRLYIVYFLSCVMYGIMCGLANHYENMPI